MSVMGKKLNSIGGKRGPEGKKVKTYGMGLNALFSHSDMEGK